MLSEEEVRKCRTYVMMQKTALSAIDVDPHNDEEAVEHKLMIAKNEGELKALDFVLELVKESIPKVITFKMFGYSDDNVELEGDISDELGAYDVVSNFVLSDGTRGTIEYTKEGVWRINILEQGNVKVNIIHPTQEEIDNDTNYSDQAIFTGRIEWIVFDGGQIFKPR
jgi:hypothetical protein